MKSQKKKPKYWPGTNIVKSYGNAFDWRSIKFGVSDELARYMGRVTRGVENAKKTKKLGKGVLVTPENKPIQAILRNLSGKQK